MPYEVHRYGTYDLPRSPPIDYSHVDAAPDATIGRLPTRQGVRTVFLYATSTTYFGPFLPLTSVAEWVRYHCSELIALAMTAPPGVPDFNSQIDYEFRMCRRYGARDGDSEARADRLVESRVWDDFDNLLKRLYSIPIFAQKSAKHRWALSMADDVKYPMLWPDEPGQAGGTVRRLVEVGY